MTNVETTTSLGETIAIAAKHQKQEAVEEVNAETAVVEIEEAVEVSVETIVVETVVVEDSSAVTTEVEIEEAAAEANAETIVGETVVVEDSSNVTIVAEIAEVATVEEAIEVATTGDRPVENIAGAMIVDHHDVIPENQVDGGPKARAGPASAEISRGAFI